MCDCIFSQSANLRWKMPADVLLFAPTLEQAWMCGACGTVVWKEVPFVREEEAPQ
jgi:hypothetical protein